MAFSLTNCSVEEFGFICISLTQIYNQEFNEKNSYKINNLQFDGTSQEYIDNKLEQLGLRRTFIIDGGSWSDDLDSQENTSLTKFGKGFIEFFRSRKIYG
ncbi:hypothetical protein RYX56_06260 [Alkalihalophilus lindianensis]|uniref:Uncharacterized protein n=1 Tax=Alkalihalophilus lindianensis TaxID=1630542 RepID=A0ABU3X7V5_9BACI|nr:hypothetical protein [Alkalihalophilus lindianensis]MDV2683976.1 hypothetical protein [Alkalihalophilus lindianensis]